MERIRPTYFSFVWLAGWTVAGVFVASRIIWMSAGEEALLFDRMQEILTIQLRVFGLNLKTARYSVPNVWSLRVSLEPPAGTLAWSKQRSLSADTALAFDYGARTVRFGRGMDESEARLLIRELRRRWPSLGESSQQV